MVEFFCNHQPFLDMIGLLCPPGERAFPGRRHFSLIELLHSADKVTMDTSPPPQSTPQPVASALPSASACRRRHPRFPVKDGSFAFDAGTFFGYLIDISLGGVSFQTTNQSVRTTTTTKLTFCGDEGFCVANLPCRQVADQPLTHQSYTGPIPIVRRCLQFTDLTASQRQELEIFIRKNATSAN